MHVYKELYYSKHAIQTIFQFLSIPLDSMYMYIILVNQGFAISLVCCGYACSWIFLQTLAFAHGYNISAHPCEKYTSLTQLELSEGLDCTTALLLRTSLVMNFTRLPRFSAYIIENLDLAIITYSAEHVYNKS